MRQRLSELYMINFSTQMKVVEFVLISLLIVEISLYQSFILTFAYFALDSLWMINIASYCFT